MWIKQNLKSFSTFSMFRTELLATLLDRLHQQTFLRQTVEIKSKKRPVWIYLWFCRNVLSRRGDADRSGIDDATGWSSESEIISLYSMLFISPRSHTRLLIAESRRTWNHSIENLHTVSRCVSSDHNKYSQPKCDPKQFIRTVSERLCQHLFPSRTLAGISRDVPAPKPEPEPEPRMFL